jgi:hypothetical protein
MSNPVSISSDQSVLASQWMPASPPRAWIAAQAVDVVGIENVEGVGLAILAELAVSGHLSFGVGPKDDIAGVAGDSVDADDVAADGLGEAAAGGLLALEGGLILGGLGLGGDGIPDGGMERRLGGLALP